MGFPFWTLYDSLVAMICKEYPMAKFYSQDLRERLIKDGAIPRLSKICHAKDPDGRRV